MEQILGFWGGWLGNKISAGQGAHHQFFCFCFELFFFFRGEGGGGGGRGGPGVRADVQMIELRWLGCQDSLWHLRFIHLFIH